MTWTLTRVRITCTCRGLALADFYLPATCWLKRLPASAAAQFSYWAVKMQSICANCSMWSRIRRRHWSAPRTSSIPWMRQLSVGTLTAEACLTTSPMWMQLQYQTNVLPLTWRVYVRSCGVNVETWLETQLTVMSCSPTALPCAHGWQPKRCLQTAWRRVWKAHKWMSWWRLAGWKWCCSNRASTASGFTLQMMLQEHSDQKKSYGCETDPWHGLTGARITCTCRGLALADFYLPATCWLKRA